MDLNLFKRTQNLTEYNEKNGITPKTIRKSVRDAIKATQTEDIEVEFKADSFEVANEFLNKIGFMPRNYQENKRIQYTLDNVEIDIDTWPMIPTYLEIEGNSEEEVNNMVKKLGLSNLKITTLNCDDIYREFYNIDISKIEELKF